MNLRRRNGWKTARLATASVAVLALSACDDSTAPTGLAGTWDLALVNGQTLPAVYLVYGLTGATKQVVSGHLEFSNARSVEDARHLRDNPGGPSSDSHDTTAHSFRVGGELVIIDRPNSAAPAQAYSDTGLVDGNVLYIGVRTVDGTPNQRHSFTYVRRE